MATIVNNPGPSERVVERTSGDATAGWAIAIIILIAIVIGAFAWVRYHGAPYAPSTGTPAGGSANINVSVPGTSGGGSGSTGGGTSGGTGGGANGGSSGY
jgi:hypothetical protein